MKNNIIGSGKPKRVSKSPWECRVRKWAKDGQGKQIGQGKQDERHGTKEHTSNVIS